MFSIDENGRSAASFGARHSETRADRIVIFFKKRGAISDSFLGKIGQVAWSIAHAASRETLRDGQWSEDPRAVRAGPCR